MLYGKQRALIDGTEDSPDATAAKVVQLTCGDHCRWSYVTTVAVQYGESMDHSSAVDMLLTCRNRGRWGKTSCIIMLQLQLRRISRTQGGGTHSVPGSSLLTLASSCCCRGRGRNKSLSLLIPGIEQPSGCSREGADRVFRSCRTQS